ncbi:MAG: glycosyltransferase family 39 protein [Kiritimatiellae bacterium]|nr:glycosyltransferase family 39 protein [Kiritimatiellia bacterium]
MVVLVGGLLAHAAWVLVGHLRADNPGNLDDSAGLVFDAPSKCHNARTRVLFGAWRTDEWTPYLHSPLHTLLMAGVFKAFGVGYVQMRWPGALAAFLSLGLLYLILRPYHRGAAWLAVALGAVNHVFLLYGRSGLLEPVLTFFMLAAVWLLGCGYRADLDPAAARRASWCFALAAMMTAFAFLTKAISSYFVLVTVAVLLLQPPARRRNVWLFLAVLALFAAAYLLFFVPANRQFLARETAHWAGRAMETDPWRTWARQPFFVDMRSAWILMVLAFLAVPFCLRRADSAEDRARAVPVLLMALVLLVGSQFLAFVQYRPLRYYLPLVPCVIALASVAAARLADWAADPVPHRRFTWPRLLLAWALGAYVFMLGVMQPVQANLPAEKRMPYELRLALGAAVALALMLLWRGTGRRLVRSARIRFAAAVAVPGILLVVYAIGNMDRNLYWTHRTENSMYDFSRMLGRDYRQAVFAGSSPTFLALENRHRSLKVTFYGINQKSMRRGRVTHLMLAPGPEGLEEIRKTFPDLAPNAPPLERIQVSGYVHDLYAVRLLPLEAGVPRREPGGAWSVEVRNPDPHSPQSVSLVALAEADGRRACLGCDEKNILPLTVARFAVAAPERPAGPVDMYLVPRHAWWPEPEEAAGRNARRLHDARAWNMRAWRLKPSSRAPASEESYVGTALAEKKPSLVGVRVRGGADPAGELRLEEWQDGQVVGRHILPADRLSPDAYFTFIAAAQGAPDRLRLVSRGRAARWVNGFLVLPADRLKGMAVARAGE